MSQPYIYLGIAFGNNPYDTSPTYVDLAAGNRVIDWSFERGRRTVLDKIDPGRLTVRLRNHDRALDPSYTSSPYAPNVLPGKRVVLDIGQNYELNPRAETNTTGRAVFVAAGSQTLTRITDDLLPTGYEVVATPTTGTDAVLYNNDTHATGKPVTAGDKVYISAWVKEVSGTLGSFTLRARGTNAAGSVIVQDVVATLSSPTVGQWYKLEAAYTVPALVTHLSVQVNGVGTTGSAMTYRATGFQMVDGVVPQPYADRTERVFSGFIEAWPQDWDGRKNEVTITALDVFDTFNVDMIPGTVYAIQKSGARVTAGLSEIGVPSGWYTGVNTGIDDVQAKTAGAEDNWLDHFQEVAVTEQGYLFQDRNGNVKFFQRHALSLSPFTDIQVTLSNDPLVSEYPIVDVDDPDFSVRDVRNDVRVTRSGGATSRAFDSASITKYRKRTYQVTTVHNDVNVPLDLATWIVNLYKEPRLQPAGVTLEPQFVDGMIPAVIPRDLADRVRLRVQPPGPAGAIDLELAIQAIKMEMKEDKKLVVKWDLAPPTGASQVWRLGTSLLGVDTYLGF